MTPDEWQVRLFGQDVEEPEHNARHDLIEALLWDVAARALALGTNVILDFGFWAREEREDFRSRAKRLGASSEVHFLEVSEDELLHRLAARNAQPSDRVFHIPEELLTHGLRCSRRQPLMNWNAEGNNAPYHRR